MVSVTNPLEEINNGNNKRWTFMRNVLDEAIIILVEFIYGMCEK